MRKDNLKTVIKKELEELKTHAESYSFEDIKSGIWFTNFIKYALQNYVEKVDAGYFRSKYPNIPVEAVVKKRIILAKQYAGIAGGLTASVYSGAIALTIGSQGGASPFTLHAAMTTFVADMLLTTNLQLKLAYDLSVLYNKPVDINDPEDIIDIIKIAFGVKAGEKLNHAVLKFGPEAVRLGVKATIHTSRLTTLKGLPVIGKYLLQRNIIKFSIPAICIPLSSGFNYYRSPLHKRRNCLT